MDWLEGWNRIILEESLVDGPPVHLRIGRGVGLLGVGDWAHDGGSIGPYGHQLRAYPLHYYLPPHPLGFPNMVNEVGGNGLHGREDLGHHVLLLPPGVISNVAAGVGVTSVLHTKLISVN